LSKNTKCKYWYILFNLDIDYCQDNPCENGGTCSNDIGKFKCSCTSDYIGYTCEYAKETFDFAAFVGNKQLNIDNFISNPDINTFQDIYSIIMNNPELLNGVPDKPKQLLLKTSIFINKF
jgi:hypothetical protein